MNLTPKDDKSYLPITPEDSSSSPTPKLNGGSIPKPGQVTHQEVRDAVNNYFGTTQKLQSIAPSETRIQGGSPEQRQAILREQREVRSWVDVAPLLQEISNGHGAALRVSFPIPSADAEPVDRETQRAEQRAIREFLCTYHGKPMEDILNALQTKLNNSAGFRKFQIGNNLIPTDQWIKQFSPKSGNGSLRLETTKIITIPDITNPTSIIENSEVLASLKPIQGKEDIKVVFESTKGTDVERKALAAALRGVAFHLGTSPAEVWLVDAKDIQPSRYTGDNDKRPVPSSGDSVELYGYIEFIEKFSQTFGDPEPGSIKVDPLEEGDLLTNEEAKQLRLKKVVARYEEARQDRADELATGTVDRAADTYLEDLILGGTTQTKAKNESAEANLHTGTADAPPQFRKQSRSDSDVDPDDTDTTNIWRRFGSFFRKK